MPMVMHAYGYARIQLCMPTIMHAYSIIEDHRVSLRIIEDH